MGTVRTSAATDIAASLGLLLQRRFRATAYAAMTHGVHHAIDPATYPVISGIARLGPVSTTVLAQEIGLDRSIVSRRAAALVRAGLVGSQPDPGDARATLLSLSPAGIDVMRTLRSRLALAVQQQMAGWPDRDVREFARLLALFVEPGSLQYRETGRSD